MGRNREPTAVLRQRGNFEALSRRKHEHLRAGGTELTVHDDAPPPALIALDPSAQAYYDTLSTTLFNAGVLTRLDAPALTRYCYYLSLWKRVKDELEGDLWLLTNGGNDMRPNPMIAQVIKVEAQLLALERQFGLTPSARASITAKIKQPEPTEEDDDLDG